MAKKKKKWKSRIKKALKLAAIGGAGYLAAKAFGGKKAPTKFGTAAGFLKSGAAGGASLKDPAMPLHLGETFHPKQPRVPDRITSRLRPSIPGRVPADLYPKIHVPETHTLDYKKGGRVTGIAKRGFGRALRKGKK